jgi:hypothetical protein
MTRRKLLCLAPVVATAGLGLAAANRWLEAAPAPSPAGQSDPKPATTLPVSQVVLFNSGVGYFTRSGEVEGDARVDLTFREADVNDLLKSMTLQDLDGGRVAAVSYDSREPIARTLASFALNLDNNPPLTQILTQARGEKVEVVMLPSAQAQPGSMSGTIVGVEKVKLPSGLNQQVEADMLNLLTADGLRAVKLMDVLRIKFTNPVLEAELKRALDVVALSHDAQKKAVSLHLSGDGRRRVKVGYVVEAPIWKTSYRLVLEKDGKPFLQGWAAVENTTDEDWSQVRMALVSGRPISFKMDLYDPLYVPRPTVEPELFASLRPPAYQGGFNPPGAVAGVPAQTAPPAPPAGLGGGGAGFGAFGAAPGAGAQPGGREYRGLVDGADRAKANKEAEERKRYAAALGEQLAQRMDLGAVQSAATATKLGDFFQYLIDHPVSLARQKSAMLPIVGKDVEGTRVSIYNPAVQPKHPLLGLKFKNTTGAHLAQGPITIYEGSTYAGDSRILDVQPNEERLLAYAIDLGVEVKTENGEGTATITALKAQKGIVHITRKFREERVYEAVNRADADRTLLIEHPNRTGQGFKLVNTPKPAEETADLWRFQIGVPAGKTEEFKVTEERELGEDMVLTNSDENRIRFVINLKEAGPELKKQLTQALALKGKWDGVRREVQRVQADLQRITADQDRIRKNLRETPQEAPVYETYLKKLSDQEKEIDSLTEKQKQLMAQEHEAKKTYEDFLGNING